MKLPKFQFSLATLLVLMSVAAAILSAGELLASESVLMGIWFVTLFTAHRHTRSLAVGWWRKVLRVTLITSAAWIACIVSTNLWFASLYAIAELSTHIAVVIGVGTVLAFFAACLLNGMGVCLARWLHASWRFRFQTLFVAFVAAGLTWSAQWAWNYNCWEPAVFTQSEWDQKRESVRIQATTNMFADVTYSLDGARFAVANNLESATILAAAGEVVARHEWPRGQRVESSSFYADQNSLAMVITDGNYGNRAVQWHYNTEDEPAPIPYEHAFSAAPPGTAYPLVMSERLLILFVEGGLASIHMNDRWQVWIRTPSDPVPQVQLWSLPLDQEVGRPISFPALAQAIRADAKPPNSVPISFSNDLAIRVSRSGKWITRGEWLYGPAGVPPKRLPGESMGFLNASGQADHVVVHQVRRLVLPRISWTKRGPMEMLFSGFRIGFTPFNWRRFVVLDCEALEMVTRTRWIAGQFSDAQDQRWLVIGRYGNNLIWDLHRSNVQP